MVNVYKKAMWRKILIQKEDYFREKEFFNIGLFHTDKFRLQKGEGLMRVIIFIILFLLLVTSYAFSDMGAILPDEKVNLTEPAQRAIIAHDGFSEILILSTDFETPEGIKAVRFIPFPSKVEISEGTSEIFSELEKLVKKYDLHYLRFLKGGGPEKEGITVVTDQTLGPHRVIQVKVKDFDEFAKWVRELFAKEGIEKGGFSQKEKDAIHYYLMKGFNYFVFDIVDLSKGTNSITPLIYKFDTRNFYYPLVTSSVFPGTGSIELFIFTNNGEAIEKITRFPMPHPWKQSETVLVTWEDMEKISSEVAHLMGKHAVLGAVKYIGTYDISYDIWFEMTSYIIHPYNPMGSKKR